MLKKRSLSILVILSMLLSLIITGCGNKQEATTTDSEAGAEVDETAETGEEAEEVEVETKVLKIFLGGNDKEGSKEVFEKANEMLETKLPGVQMDIQVIPYGEWTERWKLLTAAGDQMDVAWIGWMHNYDILAREGQILALDDLIDANASGLREALPAFVLDKAKVDGITYSVPNYQQMTEMRTGIRLYKDIADASVDVAALEAKFTSDLTFDLDDWQAIEPYFAYAKDNGMIAKGASVTLPWVVWNGYEGIGKGVPNVSGPVVKIGDPTCEVLNPFTTSQYQDMITTMADWYAKGYIREDILSVEKNQEMKIIRQMVQLLGFMKAIKVNLKKKKQKKEQLTMETQ